jgi:2-hydroxy-3-oxopropionate reductase
MTRTIARVGAGAMGGAIVARLATAGTALGGFDLDPAKVAAPTDLGAKSAPSAAAAAARGLRSVDGPLSGGIPKAASDELTLMQGGAPEDVAGAQVILARVAANQSRMGGPGAGRTIRLVSRVLCGLGFLGVADATALAEAARVEVAVIPRALRGRRSDSAILQKDMPRCAARDCRRAGRIDNMVKDVNAAADLARLTHTPMPLTALCAKVHRMLTSAGLRGAGIRPR